MRTKNAQCAAVLLALLGGAAMPLAAQAEESPWLVRVRAVNLESDNEDSTGLNLSINNKVIPEVDISYFFTPNIAAELVLTYPQKQTIYSGGAEIGSLKHLPPTLTLQYHFDKMREFKPYLGIGVNYTRFSSVHFSPAVQAALQPSVSKNSFGLALQAGVDFEFRKNWYLNLDVKKVQIRTDIKSAGAKVGEFKVDPWLLGVGVGMRF
ncbi:MAG: OmpW family outer membrane protein [Aquabacterium sp.]|uniref:OmpW/AlkL family protein n=1 Tax=Aquabacterium sp. TaxID=1872578 RepID=UPI00271C3152|nr:OmpW family outer membrane protein [Aquabacterium sp.]MDO9005311.1 OmpW family outer membrane protein [Aquabacterium sp.]